ncbi:MAG: hypothetical protein BMS9Abin02_1495 [Anaerolineae bacterium]|nr:MAG: hypothetical protein BMS9Abin02_1495 [Anaerolineae bacterium]
MSLLLNVDKICPIHFFSKAPPFILDRAMIPWRPLPFNSLWILGLAVLLADTGFHYWLAQEDGRPLGQQLRDHGFQHYAWLGLAFVGAGLAVTSGRWWEALLWSLFTLFTIMSPLKKGHRV